jgi:hypothetical protein
MRILFTFMCVLALGVMGCGETAGTGVGAGGTAGDGGSGGVVTDCTGVEDWTVCEPEMGPLGGCIDGVCFVTDCRPYEDGTGCLAGGDPSDLVPGLCEGGTCVAPVEDCTGEEIFTPCTIDGADAYCRLEQCATFDCSGLEDRTYCVFAVLGDGTLGVCEAGQCTKPEDCTGLVDGWDCIKGEQGSCVDGECVPPP